MTGDPADLANLRGLALPPPVPWWPPRPGWWIVAAGLLALAALAAVRLVHRYRANAYRRSAARAAATAAPNELGGLLKRTALVTYGREGVAGITGAEWAAFLERTGGLPQAAGRIVAQAALAPAAALHGADLANARAAVRRWIVRHKVSAP
ncbi:MAG: DUF4381 family protein [Acetobacteraceae bacterium]|nr:DUF4381 family protein [Acetobacteraceae bacterium]